MKIKLRATATHPDHNEGAIYEAEPVFALADIYQRRAIEISQNEPLTTRAMVAEPEPEAAPFPDNDDVKNLAEKRRLQLENLAKARAARRYDRRDMKASD